MIVVSVLFPVRVICMGKAHMRVAFMVTRTSTKNTFTPVAIKNFVKIVKCLEFLAKVYSAANFVVAVTSKLHYIFTVCYINTVCLLIWVA